MDHLTTWFLQLLSLCFLIYSSWSQKVALSSTSKGWIKPELTLLSTSSLSLSSSFVPTVNQINFNFNLKSIDIESGSSFHLQCKGDQPVDWKYPENIIDDLYSMQDVIEIESNCSSTTSSETGHLCVSDFVLSNATYEQTGAYTCYYKDKLDVYDSLYIFVNDDENLLVPYEGNPYFILISVIQAHPAIIPCLPTNSKTTVQLWKSHAEGGPVQVKVGNGTGVSYDPTQGFYFAQPKWDIESSYLECRAELNDNEEKLVVNIHWSIDPIYGIKPLIDKSEANHVYINGSFSLNCLVHLELGILITLSWNYPNHDSKRIFESDPLTIKTGEGSQQVETVSRELKVTNVQPEDEGYYFCNVTDARGRLYSTSTYVTVYDQSIPSSVTFSMDLNKTHFVRKLTDSLQLVVNVHAIPNVEAVSLFWYKDGEQLGDAKGQSKFQRDDNHYQMNIERNQVILRVAELTMKDTGLYVLIGNTANMTSNMSILLQVEGPPEVEILGIQRYYSFGKSYVLTCTAIATPLPEIKWTFLKCQTDCTSAEWIDISEGYNNETVIDEGSLQMSEYVVSSSLKLTAKKSGIYRCFGENVNGTNFQGVRFAVTDAGEEGFSVDSSSDEVVETDDVALTCKASLVDYIQLNWFRLSNDNHSNTLISLNNQTDRLQLVEEKSDHTLSSSIRLTNVSLSDSGRYFCNATFKDGHLDGSKVVSKHIELHVEQIESPKIIDTNMNDKLVQVWPSKQNEFYCYASGKPKPIVRWFKNGKAFNTTGLFGIELTDDNQKLIILRLVAFDSGKYQCQITNKAGTINFYSTLKVMGKKNDGLSLASIMAIITFLIVAIMIVFTAFFIGQRIRKERENQIEFFAKNLFNQGQLELVNPNTPLDEQVDLLAYDPRWEFPDNRIKLIRTLGEGAFGRVFLAEAIGIGEDGKSELVAVKMLKANSNFSQKKALIAELKILIHLGRHLNIVNCLGAVTKSLERGKLMVIVEYCCFGNLRQYLYNHRDSFVDEVSPLTGEVDKSALKNASLTIDLVNNPYYQNNNYHKQIEYVNWRHAVLNCNDKLAYRDGVGHFKDVQLTTCDLICCAFQVARGMEYLEQKRLIHRDLAARNVLVAEKGVVKICDFGLAKNIQHDDNYINKGDGLLPVKWMAIESIGNQVFTIKSDVWSFGILLWEIFTLGDNPYPAIEANKQFYNLLKSGYRMEKPSLCPISVYEIMQHCWNVNPASRPSFTRLAEKLGLMIEFNVRNYYLDLNNPYQETNKLLQEDGNYLEMNGKSTPNSSDYQYMNVTSSDPRLALQLNPMANYDSVASIRPVNGVSPVSKVPMEVVPMINFDSYDKRLSESYLNMNSSCPPNYNLVIDNYNLARYSKNVTCKV